jgi:hypothetical protein
VKNVIKNSKQQPLLKNSININIDLDDDDKKKKKPKRKKRQQTQTTTDNNVSYVDELGKPISNEIINNRSFSQSYIPQPFSRNSSVIGTSFNESAIMDRVMEKMSKLNATNQSMNNSVLNQSGTAPPRLAPPQLPRQAAPSTIAPVSPSIAPQSLNFNLSSPVRPLGSIPMSASSVAMNAVQNYALSSMRAAVNSQEALQLLFAGIPENVQAEIKKAAQIAKDSYADKIKLGSHGGAQFQKFKPFFKAVYEQPDGGMTAKEVASVAWQYYTTHLPK